MTDQHRGARLQPARSPAITAGIDGPSLRDALRQEQARLTKITSAVPGVLFELRQRGDGSLAVPYASPQIRDLLGVTARELMLDPTSSGSVHPMTCQRAACIRLSPSALALLLAGVPRPAPALVRSGWSTRDAGARSRRGHALVWLRVRCQCAPKSRRYLPRATACLMRSTRVGPPWVWDLTTDLIELDEVALKVWGRTREEIHGLSFEDVLGWFIRRRGARAGPAVWSSDVATNVAGRSASRSRTGRRASCSCAAAVKRMRRVGRCDDGVCIDVTHASARTTAPARAEARGAHTLAAGSRRLQHLLYAMLGTRSPGSGARAGAPRPQGIAEIEHAVARAADWCARILTFSRPHSLKREVSSLEQIVGALARRLRSSLPHRIEIELRRAEPTAGGPDAAQLQQSWPA